MVDSVEKPKQVDEKTVSQEAMPPTNTDITLARGMFSDAKSGILKTPLWLSDPLVQETGIDVYLKLENLQRTGSFKLRGATYKLAHLSERERKAGVITASLGNHSQGVASAAQTLGIRPCYVIMPKNAPLTKVETTRALGAEVLLRGNTYDESYEFALEQQRETGATFIHAFDDPLVIAGQGTIGQEIIHDLPMVDTIIVPVGGGGLISGIAIAVDASKRTTEIIGVQAEGAQSAKLSIEKQSIVRVDAPSTIADGIATKQPGELTFKIMKSLVHHWVTVSEQEIALAVIWLLERAKFLVEGAGAAGVAALLYNKSLRERLKNKTVAVVVSGGNIDVTLVGRFLEYGFTFEGRLLIFDVDLEDRAGQLQDVVNIIAAEDINIREVIQQRAVPFIGLQHARVTFVVETITDRKKKKLLRELKHKGYRVRELTNRVKGSDGEYYRAGDTLSDLD